MRFEFATSHRILFGQGTCAEVPILVASLGQRVLVVTDLEERCEALSDWAFKARPVNYCVLGE